MFQRIENAKLLHEAPPGSQVSRDPNGEGWLVYGYTHDPYLVSWDGKLTDITTGAELVDGPSLRREDAATQPETQ